jgi:hypothetical protein
MWVVRCMRTTSGMPTTSRDHPPTFAAPTSSSELKEDLVAALVAGQLAGVVMALSLIIVFAAFFGQPWFFPVQVIGSMVVGPSAVEGSFVFSAFVVGLLLHQVVSAVWSLVFGVMVNRLSPTFFNVVFSGLTVGLISQVLDTRLLVPTVMMSIHHVNLWAENVPPLWSWVAHLLFGLSLALFIPISRRVSELNQRGT